MSIVNGATAIGYFTHSWTPHYSQFRVSPATQAEMRRTNRQLTTLTTALLGAPVHVGVQTDVGRVDAIARRVDGATYVFAVNVSREPVRARFSVAKGTWHVVEEGRV